MTPDAKATTDAEPHANGAAHPPAEAGEIKLNLNPESKALLADWKWTNEQFHVGAWDPYAGQYIAVYHKQFRGHGPNPQELRERIAREIGAPPGKIAITYVETDATC